ncbi:acyl-CoA dehydrogenase family protein [Pseudooceanicola sp.]|uniref:acyl-CoA dehydrogenase family protein n=1 Tax=Pseudooceanicola sp. TaxID=1914328 RepID=UPI002618A16B|nr:acyl-CoA dehydrogenase family protein [Pseudooceanicola sp.]MDF1856586.1 acyl-CoA/acyl-ACP dehydrogenase [Pseudooceanicola sp.]
MNFEFSEIALEIRDQGRKYLAAQNCLPKVRAALEGNDAESDALWQGISDLGWTGAAIPEEYGGHGIGYEALCVIAEELGYSLAPVPFSSTAYLAAEALLATGSEEQKQAWLPKLASGEAKGTFALAEGVGALSPDAISARFVDGKLSGTKWPVADGDGADIAVVIARDGDDRIVQVLVDLSGPGVSRTALDTIDASRPQARIDFDATPASLLQSNEDPWDNVLSLLDRAAILTAFEEVGGTQACLDMATAYAKERNAFGRSIGSNQAIKHKLADVFVALELARSNAYLGALRLVSGDRDLTLVAATARVSSIQAFVMASSENIQTHGGIGFTWDADPQLYFRRANALALGLGPLAFWKDRLITALQRRPQD